MSLSKRGLVSETMSALKGVGVAAQYAEGVVSSLSACLGCIG